MTFEEFKKGILILHLAVGKHYTPERIEFFFEELKAYPTEVFLYACRQWKDQSKTLPTLADFRVIFYEITDADRAKSQKGFEDWRLAHRYAELPSGWKEDRYLNLSLANSGMKSGYFANPYGQHKWSQYHRRNMERYRNFNELAKCCSECKIKYGRKEENAKP